MEEAERLCERVLIMDHGHVLADDLAANLKAQHGNLEKAFLNLTGHALRDSAEGKAAVNSRAILALIRNDLRLYVPTGVR